MQRNEDRFIILRLRKVARAWESIFMLGFKPFFASILTTISFQVIIPRTKWSEFSAHRNCGWTKTWQIWQSGDFERKASRSQIPRMRPSLSIGQFITICDRRVNQKTRRVQFSEGKLDCSLLPREFCLVSFLTPTRKWLLVGAFEWMINISSNFNSTWLISSKQGLRNAAGFKSPFVTFESKKIHSRIKLDIHYFADGILRWQSHLYAW